MPKSSNAFDDFADDLRGESAPRPLVIVASSKVEQLLFEILQLYLLPKSSKKSDDDELLEGDRALSSLSSRIRLAYRLGIIDPSLRSILDQLRLLRNYGAHEVSFNINKSPLRERWNDFVARFQGRQSFDLTKERYFGEVDVNPITKMQCATLTVCVILEAIKKRIKVTKGVSKCLEISKR